ncbi:MAG: isocitrate lyase, partial [Gammaproteobacteria bacterium]
MGRESEIKKLEKEWGTHPRWKNIQRDYSAADVVRLRGSMQIEHTLAHRCAEKLWKLLNEDDYVPALGAITAGQALQQV